MTADGPGGVPDAEFGNDLVCVVADPLKFKRKLRIGEDAYAVLRTGKRLQTLWDVGGVAMTGASVAASKIVATTLFGSTAGVLSFLGLGAAATPVGWVIAAAAATGGVYYGVTRLVRRQTDGMVDAIPRFINTPIDMLGMQLLDLMGTLALKVAAIDGRVSAAEKRSIQSHFVEDWGYDPAYARSALRVLAENSGRSATRSVAKALAEFQAANPDCNGDAMQRELLSFLREVVEADGIVDEREEHALAAIATTFQEERSQAFRKMAVKLADDGSVAVRKVIEAGGGAAQKAADIGGKVADMLATTATRMRPPPRLPPTTAE